MSASKKSGQLTCYETGQFYLLPTRLRTRGIELKLACDNLPLPKRICAFHFHSLWIYTMNRCTLALRGRALLCLDFITSFESVEAA
jgi:hypothetical protein